MHPAQLKAIQIVEKVFHDLPELVRPGMREHDVAVNIRRQLRFYGAQKESFRIIAASGHRSKQIHGFATKRKIAQGELIMFDFGALYNGWRSDVTRTYVVGRPTKKHKKIWALLIKAQKSAIQKVKAGVRCDLIDYFARSIIKKAGYGQYFKHSLGHGIGRKTHEAPRIGPHNRNKLRAGQVITIEPGIYIHNWGGMRVEDMVLVTKKGYKLLTNISKKLSLS